jgi:hypothetical protein
MVHRSLALAFLGPALLFAQNPQKIVDEYFRAGGGGKSIHTASITGSLTEESTGRAGSFSMITKSPDRFYSEIIAGSDRMVSAYNGASAWGEDPGSGPRSLTGAAAKEAEAAGRYRNSALADVKKSKMALEFAGTEKVRGRDTYHVRVSAGPGVTRDLYFDAGTHLILRETAPGSAGEQFDFDDYRPVKGIATPHHIQLRRGGREYQISVTHVEYNAAVDDAIFDFPHAAGAPLPDLKTLMLEVTRNQRAIEEMQKDYTCHLTTEEEKVDGKGRVTSKTVKEFEVFNLAGEEVRHLVAKDGKPLAADEKKKEDERFNKEFEKLRKKDADLAADPKKQQKQAAKDEADISDFLRTVRFSNARRERFRGHDVIAAEFGPNRDYKPKKTIEAVIKKLAGVIWIDEQAKDVARLEAHFSDSVKIGAGVLASVDKGSSFVFEQAKVNDEVWLPTYAEVHAAGRLLVVKLKANEIDRYSEYKRFKAESKIVSVGQ